MWQANEAVAAAKLEVGLQRAELEQHRRTERYLEGDALRLHKKCAAMEEKAAQEAIIAAEEIAGLGLELREAHELHVKYETELGRRRKEMVSCEDKMAWMEAQMQILKEEARLSEEKASIVDELSRALTATEGQAGLRAMQRALKRAKNRDMSNAIDAMKGQFNKHCTDYRLLVTSSGVEGRLAREVRHLLFFSKPLH